MLTLTQYASEVHDGHTVHYQDSPCPVMTNSIQRAVELNSMPIPELQGRGLTIVGVLPDKNGQLTFAW